MRAPFMMTVAAHMGSHAISPNSMIAATFDAKQALYIDKAKFAHASLKTRRADAWRFAVCA
jgi:hypothetical protein